jgi:D-glycero-D-manno-heptose 1,7-bisphosphate phosphatase
MMEGAIFLDRDGVINEVLTERVKYVNKPKDLYLLDGVADAIKIFNKEGFKVFVVTNQGGIGLGYMKEQMLHRIHQHLLGMLRQHGAYIDDIAYCPHRPKGGCSCRKPKTGMLEYLADKHQIHLHKSIMIGDRDVDIEAGKKAGMKTVLIGKDDSIMADAHFKTLIDSVDWVIKEMKKNR